MAARVIENARDRLITILVAPLMSCSARLPIYALIIPAFFAVQWRAGVLWSMYIIGIALALGYSMRYLGPTGRVALALAVSGAWSVERTDADMRQAEQRCTDQREGKSLREAIDDGRYGAAYSCGQAIFAAHRSNLFGIWAAMIRPPPGALSWSQ